MPFLADAYGLYYNKDMFAAAGIANPPKTLSELTDDAKKLTKRKADGTIKVAGFARCSASTRTRPPTSAPLVGAQWLTADGKSAIGADAGWKSLLHLAEAA